MSDVAARPEGATRRLYGWGGAVSSECEPAAAASVADVRATFARARREGRTVGLRGAGCSYGDAALNSGGIVLDVSAMRRTTSFDPATGVVVAEPGVTIEDLWRLGLPHGYWPPVVPGTMFPTLGGCLSMNIHGKNSFAAGTLGEHVDAFTLETPAGETLVCSRAQNRDVFYAAAGGFGRFGCITSITLRLKKVPGGRLRVSVLAPKSLGAMIDAFEANRADADYLVGWIDGFATGPRLGRGIIHRADYAGPDVDPRAAETLSLDAQRLPKPLLGLLPRRWIRRLVRPLVNDAGVRLVNAAKFLSGSVEARRPPYLQSHVGFAFLLDYVPDWKLAYGRGGLIQYQSFVPAAAAGRAHSELIRKSQTSGIRPYLLVYKRHRADPYLLTHSVDGFSMAMDFRVTRSNRRRLWDLCAAFDEVVLAAGGRFYMAKDATLAASSFLRSTPRRELDAAEAVRARCDPFGILRTDLSARVFG